jgi:hypothetical protein
MNTAARMESTGIRGQIRVSSSTADLLIEAGKKHWLTPRDELVTAKGKGEMQTFWVELSSAIRRQMSNGQPSTETSSELIEDVESPVLDVKMAKSMRYVEWNVEILSDLLLKMVVCRKVKSNTGRPRLPRSLSKASLDLYDEETSMVRNTLLDEMVDVIDMQRFDPRVARKLSLDSSGRPQLIVQQQQQQQQPQPQLDKFVPARISRGHVRQQAPTAHHQAKKIQ